ncbi:uncharacterized protein LOC130139695 [Syzygium oleosum]|uniref:uncharacterized protein LOC130139695 n=1 Tax=Syzygium oleosum TaxID=219896 RepID=UPI0024BAF255|nr:uncharacterized protein LOC130139695 [Syzygium oleosum]
MCLVELSEFWVDDGLEELQRHTYLAWFYRDGLELIGPIRDFEGQQHENEDAVDWEPGDVYAPDGEILGLEDPLGNPSPEPEPIPEPVALADLELEDEFEEYKPEEEPEPVPEPMEPEPEEEPGNEEELIEINSDSESESSGSDSDWVS